MAFFGENKSINWAATEIDGLSLGRREFAEKMLMHTYKKVLFLPVTSIGGSDEEKQSIFNSAADHYSPKSNGFIHYAAKAMSKKRQIILDKDKHGDYFLFKEAAGNVEKVTADHLVLDFTEYESTDLLTAYFEMMHDALNAAAKGVKSSQGLIVYLEKLHESLADSKAKEIIEGQIKGLGESLRGGKTGYASGGSKVEFIKFDIEPTKAAIEFCYAQVAGHLGLPLSAVNGQGGSSMSDTGESDRKQTRQATEHYFLSIVRPLLSSIYQRSDFSLEVEIEDIDSLSTAMFLLESSTILTKEGKKKIAAQFGLDDEDLNLG